MNQGKHILQNNLINIIRFSNIKRLILPAILAALICFLLVKIPFSDILVPKNIDKLSSLSTNNAKNIEYFSIERSKWLYSGYNSYKDKSISEYIFYKLEDDTCYYLLVSPDKVNSKDFTINTSSLTVTAHERNDSFNSFLSQFALDINWNYEALAEASAPIILTTTSYNLTLYKILFVVLTFSLLYFSLTMLYHILLIVFPSFSPVFGAKHWHSLERIKNRSEFVMLLQAELDNFAYNSDNLYVTNNYVINLKYDEIRVIPLNKLCFIFEHGNLHKLLWLYMKVTHTIYFLCNNALKCHLTHNNSDSINELMIILKRRIPDLMVGYSQENQLKYMEIIKEKRL